ncbi:MAG: S8 family serine peptidase [Elusimicrobia bacterium]|nr:S8 family serine peptidase [Elusimicrobiota bacterium]
MTKTLRSAVALSISLSLIALAPGSNAWAQLGRMAAPTATGVSPVGSIGAAGAVTMVKPGALGLATPGALVSPSLGLPVVSIPRAETTAAAQAAAALPLSVPGASAYRSEFKKDKAMPDETTGTPADSPDSADGLDDLGNTPRRGGEGGPDDRSDPDYGGDRGGNDGLFSSVRKGWTGPSALGRLFDGSAARAGQVGGTFNAAKGASSSRSGLAKSKGMPDETKGNPADSPDSTDGLDDLGNTPRRGGEGGPDDRSDPDFGGERGGSSELFSMMSPSWVSRFGAAGRFVSTWAGSALLLGAGLGVGVLTHAISPAFFVMAPLYAAFVVPSLILHEMGHAKAADKLGDPTARLQGRLGWTPRDLLTHISPLMTIAVPLLTLAFTGLLFGGAVPVQVKEQNLRKPGADMAKIAFAGPAVNFALALLGAAAGIGLAAAGIGGLAAAAAHAFVLFNVMLGIFNLLPFFPLDGHHIVRHVVADWLKAPGAAAWLDRHAGLQLYGLVLTLMYGGGALMGLITGVTSALFLPLALFMSLAAAPGSPSAPAAAPMPESKLVLVQLQGTQRPLGSDIHLGLIDVTRPGGVTLFASQQGALSAELEAAGLGAQALSIYGAAPVAAYKRINTASIRVPLAAAERFEADMAARGFKVYQNEARSIVRPIEDTPGAVRPASETQWGSISMKDTLKLSAADKVHEIARARWGAPGVGFRSWLARSLLRLFGDAPAQPKVAVIDTGVDIEHPLVKPGLAGHKDVRPNGDGIDDNGHGTWVTSMVLNYAPWLKSITHYKAFTDGGATTDDVLKGLTMAANDGNIIMSNSWGDDGGDPASPDSQLVKKLAEEGHIMVFAAGNNGYAGANSIGSPAIAYYKDAKTGAYRVLSIAATDKNKTVTSFSSKGPGSAVTRRGGEWKDYPRKPEAAEQGNDTEGAWPGGKTRAISGTSMSTPKFAGTLALLAMMFGVTEKGAKLDAIVNAVMATLTNELNQSEASIGSGFNSVKAAYDKLLAEGFAPAAPGWVSRLSLWIMGGAK